MGRLGAGLGLARRRAASGPSYDADALAYFAAMTVPPSPPRKALLDALIVGLKSDGVWARLDWLSLFAAHGAQPARLNAKNPAQAFSLVAAPTFTADRGYAGNGSSSYLNSGWNPLSNAVHYAQNACHLGVWVNSNPTNSGWAAGSLAARINPNNGATTVSFAAQSGSGSSVASAAALGFTAWDRGGSNAGKVFRGGVEVGSLATVSSAPTASDFFVGAYNNAGTPVYSATNTRIAAVCWGAHLTAAEHLALHGRLAAYLTAIGA